MGSSPHARGSSEHRDRPAVIDGVVPARAGIFRAATGSRTISGCRPRTRGDLPIISQPGISIPWSSPHARGSSASGCRRRGRSIVVPARAGIFLAFSTVSVVGGSRPRTRGDLPRCLSAAAASLESSPHARGSSRDDEQVLTFGVVVPARAGIFRMHCISALLIQCRPRTRGDLPVTTSSVRFHCASSPHARGSSPPDRLSRRPGRVVPARAGIFPSTAASSTARTRRPRTRGDLPERRDCHDDVLPSSPHARGSSRGTGAGRARDAVVPARAGIFRSLIGVRLS